MAVWASADSTNIMRIQADQLLSQMNGRLYRQGMNYEVNLSLTDPSGNADTLYEVFTLPNNWFVIGAVRHAFRQYKIAMADEMKSTGGKHSKWLDFNIDPSDVDGTESTAQLLLHTGANWVEHTTGSNVLSKVTRINGNESGFNVNGIKSNSFNIFEEYATHLKLRGDTPQAVSGPQAYEGLIVGADDLDHIVEDGDLPPYDADHGGWADDASSVSDTRLVYHDYLYNGNTHDKSARSTTKTFTAPLGMVWVKMSTGTWNYTEAQGGPQICVHAKKGSYKGVDSTPIYNFRL